MELTLLDERTTNSEGYGAGSGEIFREEYACPCGKSIVVYEKDAIPGFRDKSTSCECEECNKKYDFSRGAAIEK
ncbi:hypothetical protein [Sporosarcina sp. G11-34]|uniref:hypothetical protein n=1 Tax=Sporosarcina sp. G11-34 TaxID=2849605 RepID=UPI0022A93EC6|nr:hypothetical protein [Sporosarcina sp. G11-34]